MQFTVKTTDPGSHARLGELVTSRGAISTPVFMPVATRGAIRALPQRDIHEIGFDIILANTYHLYLRPGTDILEKAGGLHRFMNFDLPILTDSGGFQVFSLSDFCTVTDAGVRFRSHIDGSSHLFTPEKVVDVQRVIGSDIMMVLDQCTHYPIPESGARVAMERTVSWAASSKERWLERCDTEKQALFAIVQGSVYPGLRKECALRLRDLDFPGYAIGGLSVGEPKAEYREITASTLPFLPEEKPRYMMGVGSPMEILSAIGEGVDMFDCVMPTRIARNGTLYTSTGRFNIKAARFADDFRPLDEGCSCPVCRHFTRAYLRHIYREGEIAALIYNTYHNLSFMRNFMLEIREAIALGRFGEVYRKYAALYPEAKEE